MKKVAIAYVLMCLAGAAGAAEPLVYLPAAEMSEYCPNDPRNNPNEVAGREADKRALDGFTCTSGTLDAACKAHCIDEYQRKSESDWTDYCYEACQCWKNYPADAFARDMCIEAAYAVYADKMTAWQRDWRSNLLGCCIAHP